MRRSPVSPGSVRQVTRPPSAQLWQSTPRQAFTVDSSRASGMPRALSPWIEQIAPLSTPSACRTSDSTRVSDSESTGFSASIRVVSYSSPSDSLRRSRSRVFSATCFSSEP